MANIGSFKKSGQEFVGEIVTLSLQTKGVRIVPETNRTNDNAPSHRVYVGRAEIGAAWSKRSTEGRDYLSVKLDDPSFTAPIYANLFDDEGGETFTSSGRVVASRTATEPERQKALSGTTGRGFRVVWALGEFTRLLGVLVTTQDLKSASQISPEFRAPAAAQNDPLGQLNFRAAATLK